MFNKTITLLILLYSFSFNIYSQTIIDRIDIYEKDIDKGMFPNIIPSEDGVTKITFIPYIHTYNSVSKTIYIMASLSYFVNDISNDEIDTDFNHLLFKFILENDKLVPLYQKSIIDKECDVSVLASTISVINENTDGTLEFITTAAKDFVATPFMPFYQSPKKLVLDENSNILFEGMDTATSHPSLELASYAALTGLDNANNVISIYYDYGGYSEVGLYIVKYNRDSIKYLDHKIVFNCSNYDFIDIANCYYPSFEPRLLRNTNDEGYLISGTLNYYLNTNASQATNTTLVLKYDKDWNLQWTKYNQPYHTIHSIVNVSDNLYLVGSSKSPEYNRLFFKIDLENGEILETNEWTEQQITIHNISTTYDNNFLVVGYSSIRKWYAAKLDTNLSLVWEINDLDVTQTTSSFQNSIELNNNKYVLYGRQGRDFLAVIIDGKTGIVNSKTIVDSKLYPNPATDNTTLTLELQQASQVRIYLNDMLGREITQIYNAFADAGTFTHSFATQDLTKGIYYLKILIGGEVRVEKVVVN